MFMCRMPIEILTGVNVSTLLPAWAVGGGGAGHARPWVYACSKVERPPVDRLRAVGRAPPAAAMLLAQQLL